MDGEPTPDVTEGAEAETAEAAHSSCVCYLRRRLESKSGSVGPSARVSSFRNIGWKKLEEVEEEEENKEEEEEADVWRMGGRPGPTLPSTISKHP